VAAHLKGQMRLAGLRQGTGQDRCFSDSTITQYWKHRRQNERFMGEAPCAMIIAPTRELGDADRQ